MIQKILLCAIILLSLNACEEEIKLELADSPVQWVAEANLDATHGVCRLLLSRTTGFYDTQALEYVSGAEAWLEFPQAPPVLLEESAPGQYTADQLTVNPGDSLRISIQLPDGTSIVSSQVVAPQPVNLDEIRTAKNLVPGGQNGQSSQEKYSLTAKWEDPLGQDNYYRLKIYQNGEFQSGTYILADDRLGDGAPISRPVIRQMFDRGDTLRCQLLSVDKAYYRYFTDLANGESRGLSAPTPYNPQGNWSHQTLGYFGIWYVSEKSLVAQ